jgi:hypothetical protein
MTEAEWLACADPGPMLESLQGMTSERKLALFAAACCRRAWHVKTDEPSRDGVEVVERYVEGLVEEDEFYRYRNDFCLRHAIPPGFAWALI